MLAAKTQRVVTAAIAVLAVLGASLAVGIGPVGASPTWTISTSPNRGTQDNLLYGVSCVSSTSCKAVGYYRSGSGSFRTLIESWNGAFWSVTSSPNNGTGDNGLNQVSCPSATSCEAVGYYQSRTGSSRTLIESWNGTAWTLSTSPNNGTGSNALSGVSCLSATSCKAVGDYTDPSHVERTLVESWTEAPGPSPPAPTTGRATTNSTKSRVPPPPPARPSAAITATTAVSTRSSSPGTEAPGRSPPAPIAGPGSATCSACPVFRPRCARPWAPTGTPATSSGP